MSSGTPPPSPSGKSQPAGEPQPAGEAVHATREINFRHSEKFVPILEHLGGSLLVSTYAAGKVVSVAATDGRLHLGFTNFQQAMGIAVPADDSADGTLAIGGPNVIWFLREAGPLAQQVDPPGSFDRGFLVRESFVTGNIHVHEMQWGADGQLWIVNTLFSCLSTLHEDFNFVPRWQPPFISELSPQDRCHLNGMAMRDGKPTYLTALGTSDAPRGWRENKSEGGVVLDVASGEILAHGFCMPHSPRWHDGRLFVLDSGRGRLVTVDLASGEWTEVATYPGYGRGLAFIGQFAIVAMSKARERSVFGGVPICQQPAKMRCGLVMIDLVSGRSVAFLEFESGVEELFDVQVIPNSRRTVLCGPYPREDQQLPVWVVPRSDQVPALVRQGDGGRVLRKTDRLN